MRTDRRAPIILAALLGSTAAACASQPVERPAPVVLESATAEGRSSVGNYALRFGGTGLGDIDRVKIPVDQPGRRLQRDQVPAVDRVPVEDAGVELGDHGLDAGGRERDRGVLPARPAPEVLPADHDGVRRHELVRPRGVERDVPLRQPGLVVRVRTTGRLDDPDDPDDPDEDVPVDEDLLVRLLALVVPAHLPVRVDLLT